MKVLNNNWCYHDNGSTSLLVCLYTTHQTIAGKPGVKHEALSLSLQRVASGDAVDMVAAHGHCLDSRKTRVLRHTLAASNLSGEEQLFQAVEQMKRDGKTPMVFFSVDNKDFNCPGTLQHCDEESSEEDEEEEVEDMEIAGSVVMDGHEARPREGDSSAGEGNTDDEACSPAQVEDEDDEDW